MTMSASTGKDGYTETGVKPTAGATLSPHDDSFDPSEVYDNATGSNIFETSDRDVELPKETGYRGVDDILEDFDSSEALNQAEEPLDEPINDNNFTDKTYEGVDRIDTTKTDYSSLLEESESPSESYDIAASLNNVVSAGEEMLKGLVSGPESIKRPYLEMSDTVSTQSRSMEETYESKGIIGRILG